MMFKALVLQSLYNIADQQIEYQIKDRMSFYALSGAQPGRRGPWNMTWLSCYDGASSSECVGHSTRELMLNDLRVLGDAL